MLPEETCNLLVQLADLLLDQLQLLERHLHQPAVDRIELRARTQYYDGTIYILREYYQPGFSPKEHRPWLMQLQGFPGTTMFADPSIFYKTQAQNDGTFKAIASLFADEGIDNLSPTNIFKHMNDTSGFSSTVL